MVNMMSEIVNSFSFSFTANKKLTGNANNEMKIKGFRRIELYFIERNNRKLI